MSNRTILTLTLFAILHLVGAGISVWEPRPVPTALKPSDRNADDAALATAEQAARVRVVALRQDWRVAAITAALRASR